MRSSETWGARPRGTGERLARVEKREKNTKQELEKIDKKLEEVADSSRS